MHLHLNSLKITYEFQFIITPKNLLQINLIYILRFLRNNEQ